MTASQTGVEGAVERLTACLERDQWCAGTTVTHRDLRTLLADHAALTARIAALEGALEPDNGFILEQAKTISASKSENAVKSLAWNLRVYHRRLATRQSREETGVPT